MPFLKPLPSCAAPCCFTHTICLQSVPCAASIPPRSLSRSPITTLAALWCPDTAFQPPCKDQTDHGCTSEMGDAASGNRETSTSLRFLILLPCPAPAPLVRTHLEGSMRPAQNVTISSSIHCSAIKGDMFLHSCLCSIHRPLLVSAVASLISFFSTIFEQRAFQSWMSTYPCPTALGPPQAL